MTEGKVYLSISAYFALQKVQNHPLEPPTVLHNDKHKGLKGKVTALSQSQSQSHSERISMWLQQRIMQYILSIDGYTQSRQSKT